jgi:hypothetical protein
MSEGGTSRRRFGLSGRPEPAQQTARPCHRAREHSRPLLRNVLAHAFAIGPSPWPVRRRLAFRHQQFRQKLMHGKRDGRYCLPASRAPAPGLVHARRLVAQLAEQPPRQSARSTLGDAKPGSVAFAALLDRALALATKLADAVAPPQGRRAWRCCFRCCRCKQRCKRTWPNLHPERESRLPSVRLLNGVQEVAGSNPVAPTSGPVVTR